MQGKIVKGIAGFYYVHVVESGVYECKAIIQQYMIRMNNDELVVK